MACSSWLSSSQALVWSMRSCTLPCSSRTFSISSGRQVLAQLQVQLVVAVQQVANRLHAFLDVALDGLGRVELRLLVQEPDLDARRGERLAGEVGILARHDS